MKLKSTCVLALCATPFLAACGGGGDSTLAPPTFADMETAKTALEVLYDPEAARTDVPDDTNATYAGYVGGALVGDGRNLTGELELIANFQTEDVTGTASNFSDSNEQAFSGTLIFDGDVLFGGDSLTPDTLLGSLTGDLNADGTTYDTELILDTAEFKGGSSTEAPDAVSGVAFGDLDDINSLDPSILFDGDFIAEKQ